MTNTKTHTTSSNERDMILKALAFYIQNEHRRADQLTNRKNIEDAKANIESALDLAVKFR